MIWGGAAPSGRVVPRPGNAAPGGPAVSLYRLEMRVASKYRTRGSPPRCGNLDCPHTLETPLVWYELKGWDGRKMRKAEAPLCVYCAAELEYIEEVGGSLTVDVE